MRRIARVLVLGTLMASLLGIVGGSEVASGQTGPFAYTIGTDFGSSGNPCDFWRIDLSSGEITQVNDDSTEVLCGDGLTFAPDGTLYAYVHTNLQGPTSATLLVTIDPATGEQTPVPGAVPLPSVFPFGGGMTFDAAGNLWLYGFTSAASPNCVEFTTCLWQINPATGEARFVADAGNTLQVDGLAGSCDAVYGITFPLSIGNGNLHPEIEQVDTADGGLTPKLELEQMGTATGLESDGGSGLWALGEGPFDGIGEMQVASVDLATGTVEYQQLFIDGNPEDPFDGALAGLAVSPISCETPPPPAPAPDIVLEPTFTG